MAVFRHDTCALDGCDRAAVDDSKYCSVHRSFAGRLREAGWWKGVASSIAFWKSHEREKIPVVFGQSHEREKLPLLNARLIVAVRMGAVDEVESLLKQGADPNTRDNNGRTVLMLAALIPI